MGVWDVGNTAFLYPATLLILLSASSLALLPLYSPLSLRVPNQYPLVPPSIKFKSKIFHPNVLFESGEICLDILKKEWSPAWSLHSACRAIVALLSDPAHDRYVVRVDYGLDVMCFSLCIEA
jgi:hypothetical protein